MPGKFTSIPGVSDQRRLPRLGKIRLGKKVPVGNSNKMRPTETPHFIVPEEVAAVYGEEPTKLDVMLPVVDQSVVFPVAYKAYKKSGLFCIGNGEFAERREDGKWVDRPCPCPMLEKKECRRSATLSVVLPKVNIGGVYQIVTGSIHSIMDVLSGMDYARALLQGKLAWQPLVLERTEKEVTYTDPKDNKPKKRKHWTMLLTFEGDVDFANKLIATNRGILTDSQYLLPAPNEAIHDDPPDLVEEDIEEASAVVIDGADHRTAEVVDAERVPTGERGDDGPATVTPSDSNTDNESAAHQQAKKDFAKQLMGACKAVAGPDGAIDLFTFFVKEHLGLGSSADAKPADLMPILDRLVAIGEIQDAKEMENALEEYKWELIAEKK